MSFDQSRRTSPDQTKNGQSASKTRNNGSKPDQAGDIRELVGTMVSSKKVGTNRNNAKKSTGPKTPGGKSHARWNALKHGAFAKQRLIHGENQKAYQRLSARVYAEVTPDTAVECMLVDQIVGDLWRLNRVEQAERAYFEHIRAAAMARAMRTLSREERAIVASLAEKDTKGSAIDSARKFEKLHLEESAGPESLGHVRNIEEKNFPARRGDEVTLHCARQKLDVASDLNNLMLDGMVPPDKAFPFDTLGHIRRSLVRDVLRKCANLAEL